MNFKFPVFGRRKLRDPLAGPAKAPAPAPTFRPRAKKASFIAAARGFLAAANAGPSALASRWQLVLQQANADKQ
jgi:hypothetical protein